MNKNGKQTHRVAVESFTMNGQTHVEESATKFTKKGMGILCFYQKEKEMYKSKEEVFRALVVGITGGVILLNIGELVSRFILAVF